jgi:hypothetical protein
MSFKAIDWAFKVRGLSFRQRCVLLNLARRANHKDVCWPSIPTIVEDCETDRRTVTRVLKELQDFGLLHRELRYAKSGRSTSNVYCLRLQVLMVGGVNEPSPGGVYSPGGEGYIAPLILESSSESSSESKTVGGPTVSTHQFLFGVEPEAEINAQNLTSVDAEPDQSLLQVGCVKDMKAEDVISSLVGDLTEEEAIKRCQKKGDRYPPLAVHRLWKDLNRVFKTDAFVIALSGKTTGQCKLIANKLGDHTVPTTVQVVKRWSEFVNYVKKQGPCALPSQPNLDFYLKHVELAGQFAQEKPSTKEDWAAEGWDVM